mmetsp:Transcript_3279/g.6622  ORF Transcript_3279/g.6622 Transcript_3279/m.6622 type:complete len:178 (+) Transcript_3279:99-632(+)
MSRGVIVMDPQQQQLLHSLNPFAQHIYYQIPVTSGSRKARGESKLCSSDWSYSDKTHSHLISPDTNSVFWNCTEINVLLLTCIESTHPNGASDLLDGWSQFHGYERTQRLHECQHGAPLTARSRQQPTLPSSQHGSFFSSSSSSSPLFLCACHYGLRRSPTICACLRGCCGRGSLCT